MTSFAKRGNCRRVISQSEENIYIPVGKGIQRSSFRSCPGIPLLVLTIAEYQNLLIIGISGEDETCLMVDELN